MNAMVYWVVVLMLTSTSRTQPIDDDDVRCSVLKADGNIKDKAQMTWRVQNLTIDSLNGDAADIGPRSRISFNLSNSLLQPVLCQGLEHSPEVHEFQLCRWQGGEAMNDPWVSFSFNFLLEGFIQINTTWSCTRGSRRYDKQVTN
jgi:hypothetical protein